MKNLFFLLLFGFATLTYSCQSNQPASQDTTSGTKTGDDQNANNSDGSGNEAYTVTVLKSDIPSPRKEMKGTLGDVMVTVNYGSPSKKDRNLWGGLVPYDQVWRAGANEATWIEISKDVKINGKDLPAGKYGFFVHPKEGSDWEVIFNEVADQWGAYDYDQTKDVLRVNASPSMGGESSETMEFTIDGNALVLHWGTLSLPIPISG